MSHSSGMVLCDDGTFYYVEYNGTVDVLLSNLYDTYEEMESNWHKQEWKHCQCSPKGDEKARVAVTYGGGFSWLIKICRTCKCVTDFNRPSPYDYEDIFDIEYENGLPEWFPNKEAYEIKR